MKLLSTLALTTVSASRQRRQDITAIDGIRDAWNEMVTLTAAAAHGCHCINIASDPSIPSRHGKPQNDLDWACLDWMNALRCQQLAGGVCEGQRNVVYQNHANCSDNDTPCQIALCLINQNFANRVNTFSVTDVQPVAESECSRDNNPPRYDSCCMNGGDNIDTFLQAKRYNSDVNNCASGELVDATPAVSPFAKKLFLKPDATRQLWVFDYNNDGASDGTFTLDKKLIADSSTRPARDWHNGYPLVHHGTGKVYDFVCCNKDVPTFDYATGAFEGMSTLQTDFWEWDTAVWTPEYGVLVFHPRAEYATDNSLKVENPFPNPGQAIETFPDMPQGKAHFKKANCFYRNGKVYIASGNENRRNENGQINKIGYLLILDLSTKTWSTIRFPQIDAKNWNWLFPWGETGFVHLGYQNQLLVFELNDAETQINMLNEFWMDRGCQKGSCFPFIDGNNVYMWKRNVQSGHHIVLSDDGQVVSQRRDWSTRSLWDTGYTEYARDNAAYDNTWASVLSV